jgi:hypothetical protein
MAVLADWALWTTQDEYTGSLRTSRRAAGVIVAAAMLAELVTCDAIRVTSDRVVVLGPVPVPVRPAAAWRTAVGGPGWPAGARELRRPPLVDALAAEVLAQIVRDPALTPAEVIGGLAGDIRERVARRLIVAGAADRRRRWRSLRRRELVAVAREHDVRPASSSTGPIVKILRAEALTSEELFVMHLLADSSLGQVALGHIRQDTVRDALGPVHAIEARYRPLLATAITLLRDLALAR